MATVYCQLHDGRKVEGGLWDFRPALGKFSLIVDHNPDPVLFHLRDVATAIVSGVRRTYPAAGKEVITTNYDLLARARDEGWNGS